MALNDALYPFYGVARLRTQRGQRWSELVDYLSTLPSIDPHVMAFTLTVRRLRKTYSLETSLCKDPFCAVCASHVLDQFAGSEDELLHQYYRNLAEIKTSLRQMDSQRMERRALPLAIARERVA